MSDEKTFYKVENGEFEVCTPLITFSNKEKAKQYVVYTIKSEEKTGVNNIYASAFEGDLYNLPLFYILDLNERKMIRKNLNNLIEKYRLKSILDIKELPAVILKKANTESDKEFES